MKGVLGKLLQRPRRLPRMPAPPLRLRNCCRRGQPGGVAAAAAAEAAGIRQADG
ncbi:MAG: hypothetical protein ACLU9S_02185 [Oscillospiraceae bacterium]